MTLESMLAGDRGTGEAKLLQQEYLERMVELCIDRARTAWALHQAVGGLH